VRIKVNMKNSRANVARFFYFFIFLILSFFLFLINFSKMGTTALNSRKDRRSCVEIKT
jgi:hypothetical protein